MGRSYLPEAWARDPAVSVGCKALAAVLSSYAESENGDQDVWPAPTTIRACLSACPRTIQDWSGEGERVGWWTRTYERRVRGGTSLTYTLHFPVIAPTSNGAATERQYSADEGGEPHATERQRSGNGAATERQPGAARIRRVEGGNGRRDEGSVAPAPAASQAPQVQPALDLEQPPAPEKPSRKRNIDLALTVQQLWNAKLWRDGEGFQPKAVIRPDNIAVFAAAARKLDGFAPEFFDFAAADNYLSGEYGPSAVKEPRAWLAADQIDKALVQFRKQADFQRRDPTGRAKPDSSEVFK